MSERTFDDFDAYAGDYRSVHTKNIKLSGADSFYFAKMKVELLSGVEKNNPAKVLDLGCGDGATEIFMKEYFPSWEINGIDISEKSIEVAKARNLPAVSFSVYNGTKTMYENESFDIVFMAGVLHHVEKNIHAVIIKEVYRILKKGGRLYLFEHNPFNPVTRHLVNTCVFDKDAKLLKAGYTSAILQQNNFKIDQKRYIIFFLRKGILSKFIFLERYLQWIPLGGQYFIIAKK